MNFFKQFYMNKFLIFLLLIFTFLHACKDDSKPDVLEINQTELIFQKEAGNMGFIVKSNLKWTVEYTETWLTCDPASGEYSSNLTVKVNPNVVSTNRESTLAIKSEDGKIVRELKVSQSGFPVDITVPASALANMEGGDVNIQVTAPTDYAWTTQIPDGAFVSEKSKTDSEIVFVALPNNTGEGREVEITFKLTGTDKEAKLTIMQPTKEVVTIRAAGTLAAPAGKKYTTDAAEQDWKDYIPGANRFIMQDHKAATTTRGLHVILIKNVTDQATGPVEFKLEGFNPDAATVRWDQNDLFEGNSTTNTMINTTLKNTGLEPDEEVFVLFRIRNTAIPQNTAGEYISKFTVTGEGINIKGTIEMTVVP